MKRNLNNIIDDYIRDINKTKNSIEKLVIFADHEDEIPSNEIYTYGILGMCIRFESFCADAFAFWFPQKPVKYNHPWFHIRELAKALKVDITDEYTIAHRMWELYNSLKHINYVTENDKHKVMVHFKLNNLKEVFYFFEKAIINLMNKIKVA